MAELQGHSQVIKVLEENKMLKGVDIHLDKELGRGSYAAVYQAEWRGLSCVAKVFHVEIFPSHPAETWKQLAREIELLQHIRHPNIVQLLGFVKGRSKIPTIIMERLDTNLTTLIKENHSLLSLDMQVGILLDIAVGLNFLHEEPIIHRDLSSNNILVTEHLIAKISDLGLAKHIKSTEQQTGSFAGFGTPYYMPPEVLGQQPPQISPKTDVFSFGVVMLQVATGKAPDVKGILNVDTEVERRKNHIDLLGESNLYYPLVLQCLNNNSGNRPTAIVLCGALRKFRNSTLKLTKARQEEKVEFTKHLEAFQLQRNSDIEVIQKKLQEQVKDMQTKLDKEKAAAALLAKNLKRELRDALERKNNLEKRVHSEKEIQNKLHAQIIKLKDKVMEAIQCQSLDTVKQLVEQNQELTELLDSTNNNLNAYKKNYNTLMELVDSLNLEHVSVSINDKVQKCRNDGKSMSAKLQNMESHLLSIDKSLQDNNEKAVVQMATAVSTKNQVYGTSDEQQAAQPTKYQHAVEENKQLKRDNQELGNALERAQAELQVFKENSMALKEQLDKARDQATLDVITDKMSKYKNERDDARAQVQALQEQLHSQGSSGGGASADIVIKMSRYRDERNEALVQVQAQQAEIAKLSNIIAQMASSQAAPQPSATIFNRQTSEEQPSSQGTKKVSSALRRPNWRTVIKEVDIANGKQAALCEPVSSTLEVKKGQRVVVCRAAGNGYGTVRAVNVSIDGKKNFTGVEMDLPSGTTDGEVKGVRHFTCKPKHAVFVPVKTIFKLTE